MHRQRTVNMLTDNSPTFNVTRMGEAGDEDVFLTLERLARHWWIEQEQQAVLEKSVINGETYGVAVEKVIFDPDLEYGLGEVRTVAVDPFRFAVYPPIAWTCAMPRRFCISNPKPARDRQALAKGGPSGARRRRSSG